MELYAAQQQQGWAMNPYMQAGQNPYAYGGGGGGGSGAGGGGGGGANANMQQQNPYAYAQHPMMFSIAAMCNAGPHRGFRRPARPRARPASARSGTGRPPAYASLGQPHQPPHHVA